jgi:Na+-driven multidrug efflux pump
MLKYIVKRLALAIVILLGVSLGYSVLLWACVMAFPHAFAGMFASNAALADFAASALRIYCAVLLIFGVQIACQMTFVSLCKALCSVTVAVMRKFVLLLPLIYIMPALFEGNKTRAVYAAEPVADFLAVSFTAVLFAVQFKKILKTMQRSKNDEQ